MTANLRASRLSDITWNHTPAPPSPALDSFAREIDAAMARDVNTIIRRRAEEMRNGLLPYSFCPVAAALARKMRGEAA